MELECLLRQVRSKINFSLQCGEDSAVAGWRQKEGILMTRDNAVQLLKKIESLTAEVERQAERILDLGNTILNLEKEVERLKSSYTVYLAEKLSAHGMVYDEAFAEAKKQIEEIAAKLPEDAK